MRVSSSGEGRRDEQLGNLPNPTLCNTHTHTRASWHGLQSNHIVHYLSLTTAHTPHTKARWWTKWGFESELQNNYCMLIYCSTHFSCVWAGETEHIYAPGTPHPVCRLLWLRVLITCLLQFTRDPERSLWEINPWLCTRNWEMSEQYFGIDCCNNLARKSCARRRAERTSRRLVAFNFVPLDVSSILNGIRECGQRLGRCLILWNEYATNNVTFTSLIWDTIPTCRCTTILAMSREMRWFYMLLISLIYWFK